MKNHIYHNYLCKAKHKICTLVCIMLVFQVNGYNASGSKISKAHGSDMENYSYTVRLLNSGDRFICFGLLAEFDLVLIPAGCLVHPNFTPRKTTQINVAMGSNEKAVFGVTNKSVKHIIIHPEYDLEKVNNNDIALLRLQAPFDSTHPAITTIKITKKNLEKCRWGKSKTDCTEILKKSSWLRRYINS